MALSNKSQGQLMQFLKWGTIAIIIVIILGWIAAILGLDLYNAIENNTELSEETRKELYDKKSYRDYFISIIVIVVLGLIAAIAYTVYVWKYGMIAKRTEDAQIPLMSSSS